jgi:hypothetical protein
MQFEHVAYGPVLLIVLQNAVFFSNLSDKVIMVSLNFDDE